MLVLPDQPNPAFPERPEGDSAEAVGQIAMTERLDYCSGDSVQELFAKHFHSSTSAAH